MRASCATSIAYIVLRVGVGPLGLVAAGAVMAADAKVDVAAGTVAAVVAVMPVVTGRRSSLLGVGGVSAMMM